MTAQTTDDLWQLHLEALIATTQRAGVAIAEIFDARQRGEDFGLEKKADLSPLTLADQRAHDIIAAALAELTPEVPCVSEEDDDSHHYRLEAGRFWIIDPLDGTREFVSGFEDFTVNIGLVESGVTRFGIVGVPMRKQVFWGAPNHGAWLRDEHGDQQLSCAVLPARDDNGTYERPLRILASRQHLTVQTQQWIDRHQPHRVDRYGSSLKFCQIARGDGDCYPRLGPTAEWDTAAAQAIVEGAGGHVVVEDGSALRYGKTDVINPSFLVLGSVSDGATPPSL